MIRPCPLLAKTAKVFSVGSRQLQVVGGDADKQLGSECQPLCWETAFPVQSTSPALNLRGSASPSTVGSLDVKRNKFRQTLPGGNVDSRTLTIDYLGRELIAGSLILEPADVTTSLPRNSITWIVFPQKISPSRAQGSDRPNEKKFHSRPLI